MLLAKTEPAGAVRGAVPNIYVSFTINSSMATSADKRSLTVLSKVTSGRLIRLAPKTKATGVLLSSKPLAVVL